MHEALIVETYAVQVAIERQRVLFLCVLRLQPHNAFRQVGTSRLTLPTLTHDEGAPIICASLRRRHGTRRRQCELIGRYRKYGSKHWTTHLIRDEVPFRSGYKPGISAVHQVG